MNRDVFDEYAHLFNIPGGGDTYKHAGEVSYEWRQAMIEAGTTLYQTDGDMVYHSFDDLKGATNVASGFNYLGLLMGAGFDQNPSMLFSDEFINGDGDGHSVAHAITAMDYAMTTELDQR